MAAKKKTVSKEDIVLQALKLAEELGWEHVTLPDIAEAAGVDMAALHADFADKTDILVVFGRMIDARVLEGMGGEASPEASTRDRLFDVMMERFDVLNEYRGGITAILQSFRYDPKQAVVSCPYLCRSMVWMLEVSGVNTNGIRGAIKVSGLTALYLNVLRVWAKDDAPDLGKTMAALDKDLGRVEKLATSFGF